MKTIQITMDEPLLGRMNVALREFATTRSALIRAAVADYLDRMAAGRLERKHRAGYRKKPVAAGECSGWEGEQRWPD